MSNKNFPLITAKDAKDFLAIEEKIKTLPVGIVDRIESCKRGVVGIECILSRYYNKSDHYLLPDYTTQINDFGDYIGCYAGDFFFKIIKKETDTHFNYLFIKQ